MYSFILSFIVKLNEYAAIPLAFFCGIIYMAMIDTKAIDYLGDNVPKQPFNEWEFLIAGGIFFY